MQKTGWAGVIRRCKTLAAFENRRSVEKATARPDCGVACSLNPRLSIWYVSSFAWLYQTRRLFALGSPATFFSTNSQTRSASGENGSRCGHQPDMRPRNVYVLKTFNNSEHAGYPVSRPSQGPLTLRLVMDRPNGDRTGGKGLLAAKPIAGKDPLPGTVRPPLRGMPVVRLEWPHPARSDVARLR